MDTCETLSVGRSCRVVSLAPGPSAAAVAALTPDERLNYESTRFLERDADAEGAGRK